MTTLQTYSVVQGDTLRGIAARTLGSAERWREIAVLNRLRAPFISDEPGDQYGQPLAVGVLADDLAAGDTTVTIPGERADLLTYGCVLFLDGQDANGGYVYDAPRLRGYDATTGIVTLLDPLARGWSLGGRYRVCPPQAELDSQVARSGTTIALPLPATRQDGAIVAPGDLIDLFGTDIAVSPAGDLALQGGDLALVTGVPNVQQALRFRALLPLGDAIWHPEEGNRALDLLGAPGDPALAHIVALYTRAAMSTDPRVREIASAVGSQRDTGAVEVACAVTLIDNNQQIRVNAIVRDR